MPPLRERPEDIPLVARALIEGLTRELGRPRCELEPEAERALVSDRWPGNVRELRNALERSLLRAGAGPIMRGHLALESAARASGSDDPRLTLAELERLHIERALAAENGHVERAAKRLGVPRSTFYQRLRQMGITPRRVS